MHLLRRRPFALLFAGTAVNSIGSWTALMALWGFATYHFHVGAGSLATLAAAWSIPAALLGPFAGVPIDRLGPKRVLMAADAMGVVAALGMILAGTYDGLIYCAVLQGVVKAFGMPAAAALPPRIVEDDDLAAANALLGAATDSAIVFGPLVAAVSIALWGFHAAFVVDALTYVVGVLVVAPLAVRHVPRGEVVGVREEIAAGVRITFRHPALRLTMVLSAAVFLTWSAFVVVEPLYVRDVLGRSTTVFALMQVSFGVGLVVAGLLVSRFADRVATMRGLAVAVILSGAAATAYVGTHSVIVAGAGVFLWGVDVAFFSAPARTLLQRHAPVEAHGRVLSLQTTLHSWSDVVAIPVAGVLAAAVGVQSAAMVFVVLVVTVGVLGFVAAGRIGDGDGTRRGTALGGPSVVVETGVDPVTSRFSGARSAN